jgi:hypothetical protein
MTSEWKLAQSMIGPIDETLTAFCLKALGEALAALG